MPVIGGGYHPKLSSVIQLAFYDWLRRSGPATNVSLLTDALNAPLATLSLTPIRSIIPREVQPSGSISYTVASEYPQLGMPISNKQFRAISGSVFNGAKEDDIKVVVRDFVLNESRTLGGLHAGEPYFPGPDSVSAPPATGSLDETYKSFGLFPVGPAGGYVRPTYKKTGCAVEIRFSLN